MHFILIASTVCQRCVCVYGRCVCVYGRCVLHVCVCVGRVGYKLDNNYCRLSTWRHLRLHAVRSRCWNVQSVCVLRMCAACVCVLHVCVCVSQAFMHTFIKNVSTYLHFWRHCDALTHRHGQRQATLAAAIATAIAFDPWPPLAHPLVLRMASSEDGTRQWMSSCAQRGLQGLHGQSKGQPDRTDRKDFLRSDKCSRSGNSIGQPIMLSAIAGISIG